MLCVVILFILDVILFVDTPGIHMFGYMYIRVRCTACCINAYNMCDYSGTGTHHVVLCCCFSHSAHWLPTRKKLLYAVANPARGLLNREKRRKKEKSGSAPPPPSPSPARAARSEKKKKKKKSRGASTCLGATHVGVTQVVSVRLASVQGFL